MSNHHHNHHIHYLNLATRHRDAAAKLEALGNGVRGGAPFHHLDHLRVEAEAAEARVRELDFAPPAVPDELNPPAGQATGA